ncbi:unnamed protein product [Closterium sp. NIES-65]|nr:unnamed protein product [Closterium sp. NIES-65]
MHSRSQAPPSYPLPWDDVSRPATWPAPASAGPNGAVGRGMRAGGREGAEAGSAGMGGGMGGAMGGGMGAMAGAMGMDAGARGGADYSMSDPIWAAIRAEARLEAEREPILSSFLYASILAHSCFERSLGFVLANRLQNVTLLATQLMDVFDSVLMLPNIRAAIRADVQAVRDRDPSCRSYSNALLYYKGYHALQSYRIAHALWNRGQRILALALQSRISEVFAVDIHPAARIGRGILMDHGTGVVIGETAIVGDRVSLLQGVTLGGTGKEAGDRHPKVQEDVLIGAGATVLGNISIGQGSMIAAGSLVLKDVPPHSMVAGTPAKVVGTLSEPKPALTMQHVSGSCPMPHGDLSSSTHNPCLLRLFLPPPYVPDVTRQYCEELMDDTIGGANI